MANILVDLPSGIMTMLFECKYLKWEKQVLNYSSVRGFFFFLHAKSVRFRNAADNIKLDHKKQNKTLSSVLTVRLDLGASEQDYQAARKR